MVRKYPEDNLQYNAKSSKTKSWWYLTTQNKMYGQRVRYEHTSAVTHFLSEWLQPSEAESAAHV